MSNFLNPNQISLDDDGDIQAKKELLQKEIIDRNLNKEHFIDFCSVKKPNGDDLSKWTIPELQEIINEFLKCHEDELKEMAYKQEQLQKNQQRAKEIQLDIEKMREEAMRQQTYTNTKEVICKKLEKSILNDKVVHTEVRNPKAVETGFFKANYITYEVFTDVTNWTVRRRFSDFVWLRETLIKFFPRMIIPPMPNKKIGTRRFEEDFIEKRMKFLDRFIKGLVINETFKASEPLIAFLSMLDRSQFEFKMKELTSFTPSQYIEDIKTLTGTLHLLEDDGNDNYYKNISNYFRLQGQLYERMNYNLKNFYYNVSAATTNLEEVQKDYETLALLNSRVLMREEITKTFEELGIFFKNWRRVLYNQNELIKTYVRDFFRYIQMESGSFEELVQSRDALKAKYIAEHTRLCNKKDKLWASMDVSKWEIVDEFEKVDRMLLFRDKTYACAKMCTRDTQFVENLHKQLDYANCMNNEELKRLIDGNAGKFFDNIREFTQLFYPTLNDSLEVWSHLASFFDNK